MNLGLGSGLRRCRLGDSAWLLEWEVESADTVMGVIARAMASMERVKPKGLQECVPGFRSLTLHFEDPVSSAAFEWEWGLERLIEVCGVEVALMEGGFGSVAVRVVEIPVCYDLEFGWDLEEVAAKSGLGKEEVVAVHSGAEYRVQMIGFSPGFPYLAGLPEVLQIARRGEPRLRVAAGSVAIAGGQAGIYPQETPGGWSVLGRTPIRMFCAESEPPCWLRMGDGVKFVPISRAEYERMINAMDVRAR